MGRAAWIACLVGVALGPASGTAQTLDDSKTAAKLEETRALHERFIQDDALQLERPVAEPEPPEERSEPPGWLRALGDFVGDAARVLAPVLRVLFWVGLAAVAGGVVLFILRETMGVQLSWRRKQAEGEGDDVLAALRPDATRARSLLEEADGLARAGRFAEAVHLLLFRSIQDIQERQGDDLAQSLTAREIGRLDALPAAPRNALSSIISIVERSFFGARDVNQEDWREARTSYESFAFGGAWT